VNENYLRLRTPAAPVLGPHLSALARTLASTCTPSPAKCLAAALGSISSSPAPAGQDHSFGRRLVAAVDAETAQL
jgi:hypothetical protein